MAQIENERDEIDDGHETQRTPFAEKAPHHKEHPAKHGAGA